MNDIFEAGGSLFVVIIFMGLVALVVFLERALHLHRARIDETDFLQGIFNTIRRGNVAEALTLCEEAPGPVPRLLAIAIRRRDSPRQMLVDELEQAGRAEISRMERRLSILALVAQITPLMGLLGTVLGILEALVAMRALAPLVQSVDITSGLIMGAVNTAAGLLVAIPCFIGFNVLVVKIDRLVLDMRHACSEALFFFTSPGKGEGADEHG